MIENRSCYPSVLDREALLEAQGFERWMPKRDIRNWPEDGAA